MSTIPSETTWQSTPHDSDCRAFPGALNNCDCGVFVVAAAVLLARRNPQQVYAQSLPKDVDGDSLRRCFRAGLFSSTPTLPYEEGNVDAEAETNTGNAADTLVKVHQLVTLFRLNRDVMGAVIPKGLRGCDSRARRSLTTEAELFSDGARAFGLEQLRRRHVDLLKEAFVVDEALPVEKARVMDASAIDVMQQHGSLFLEASEQLLKRPDPTASHAAQALLATSSTMQLALSLLQSEMDQDNAVRCAEVRRLCELRRDAYA
ncbi:hypothetical protein Ct61P_14668 [Colletotrichum tofieldiae]|nr:hypothetical protein Ct61P_14668 [Colletotrichum tofieldiae]